MVPWQYKCHKQVHAEQRVAVQFQLEAIEKIAQGRSLKDGGLHYADTWTNVM